jgi:hypothetical protein
MDDARRRAEPLAGRVLALDVGIGGSAPVAFDVARADARVRA